MSPRRSCASAVMVLAIALLGQGHASAGGPSERGAGAVRPPAAVVPDEARLPTVPLPVRSFAGVVAIDGEWAFIGVPGRASGGDPGSVHVYRLETGIWTPFQMIPNPNTGTARTDNFGASLAVLGTVAVIGAPYFRGSGSAAIGKAYRYTFDGTTWERDAVDMVRPPGTPNGFGSSVAIAPNFIAVGAPDAVVSTMAGAVVVYDHDGLSPTLVTHASATVGSLFGASVAVSGSTLLVGAPAIERAFPFEHGTDWEPMAELFPPVAGASQFGKSVALALDGTRALVGAPSDPVNFGTGAVYAYDRAPGGTWPAIGGVQLSPEDARPSDNFGAAVALSVSGSEAVIGAPLDEDPVDLASTNSGSAYFFSFRTEWVEVSRFQAEPRAAGQRLGTYVAISGSTVLAGAPEAAPSQTGYVAVFSLPSPSGTACTTGGRCESGACTDGVCCDVACDGECLACSVAAGAAADGVCGADLDDTSSCTSTCGGGAGTCTAGLCVTTVVCPDTGVSPDASAPPDDSGVAGTDTGTMTPPRYRVSGCKCGVSSVRRVPGSAVFSSALVLAIVGARRRRRLVRSATAQTSRAR